MFYVIAFGFVGCILFSIRMVKEHEGTTSNLVEVLILFFDNPWCYFGNLLMFRFLDFISEIWLNLWFPQVGVLNLILFFKGPTVQPHSLAPQGAHVRIKPLSHSYGLCRPKWCSSKSWTVGKQPRSLGSTKPTRWDTPRGHHHSEQNKKYERTIRKRRGPLGQLCRLCHKKWLWNLW